MDKRLLKVLKYDYAVEMDKKRNLKAIRTLYDMNEKEEYHIDENLLNAYKKKIEECTTELPKDTVLHYRIKSKYSIYNKLKKYEKEWINPNINSLDDLIAFRIITDTSESCFKALEKLMDNGEIIEENNPEEFFNNPSKQKTKDFLESVNIWKNCY